MIFEESLRKEISAKCDFSDDFIALEKAKYELDGLTAADVQRINHRVKESAKQQEVRQGKSRKVASQIFSG